MNRGPFKFNIVFIIRDKEGVATMLQNNTKKVTKLKGGKGFTNVSRDILLHF